MATKETYGMEDPVDSASTEQLIVRNSDVRSMPVLLLEGIDYPRGCLVYGATPDAIWAKVATGAMPGAGDLIGVVPEALIAAAIDNNAGVRHLVYITGELSLDTVFNHSTNDLTAANVLALKEVAMRQGLHFVKELYGTFVPAV